jgi:hypothetical protein
MTLCLFTNIAAIARGDPLNGYGMPAADGERFR